VGLLDLKKKAVVARWQCFDANIEEISNISENCYNTHFAVGGK